MACPAARRAGKELADKHHRHAQHPDDQRQQVANGTVRFQGGIRYVDSVGMINRIMAISGPLMA